MADTLTQPDAPPSMLIIDTGHLALVGGVLTELALGFQEPAAVPGALPGAGTSGIDRLGLTRWELRDSDDRPLAELDGVLLEVRRRIAARHGGWLPALGKARQVGSTVIAGGNPKPTAASLNPRPVPVGDDAVGQPLAGPASPAAMLGGHPKPTVAGAAAAFAPLGGHPKPTGVGSPEPFDFVDLDDAAAADTSTPTVRIGLIDTPLSDLATPAEVWTAHSAFVRHVVLAAAPAAEIVPRYVLDGPHGTGDLWDVANAMVELANDEQVDILLLPLACFTADGQAPLLLERAVQRISPTTLIIAAAGNQTLQAGWSVLDRGRSSPAWPAAIDRVRALGTVFDTDQPGEPAPQEPTQPWVDALTVESAFSGPFFTGSVALDDGTSESFDGLARWRGTSFCAAHAAGLVAARMSTGSTAQQAWDALLAEATDLRAPAVGGA